MGLVAMGMIVVGTLLFLDGLCGLPGIGPAERMDDELGVFLWVWTATIGGFGLFLWGVVLIWVVTIGS